MTGPEIWQQTDGRISAVTFSTGTGGTIAGKMNFMSHLQAVQYFLHLRGICSFFVLSSLYLGLVLV